MRKGTTLAIAVVLIGIGWYGWSYQPRRWAERFEAIAIGDTEDAVVQRMGVPDRRQERPHWLWCNASECEREFMYGQEVPPEWWVVGFNAESRVVWKAHLQSP